MTETSARRRRAGRWALAAGAAFALPLTATVVHAGQDAPPPPAVSSGVEAPTPPAAPKIERRVMVIEHADHAKHVDADGKAKFEKRLERDGKTVVIRSDKPIDEAELEAKLSKLDKLKDADWDFEAVDGAPGEKRVVRKFVMHDAVDDPFRGKALALVAKKCGGDPTLAEADASRETGDAKAKSVSRTHVLLCGKAGQGKAEALAKIRSARDSIAGSDGMASDLRADILNQLDAAVARLEKEGD